MFRSLGEDSQKRHIHAFLRPADKVVPEISKFGGHVIQSSLSDEQEHALQEALDRRGAAV